MYTVYAENNPDEDYTKHRTDNKTQLDPAHRHESMWRFVFRISVVFLGRGVEVVVFGEIRISGRIRRLKDLWSRSLPAMRHHP